MLFLFEMNLIKHLLNLKFFADCQEHQCRGHQQGPRQHQLHLHHKRLAHQHPKLRHQRQKPRHPGPKQPGLDPEHRLHNRPNKARR